MTAGSEGDSVTQDVRDSPTRAIVLTVLSLDQAHAAVTVVGAWAQLQQCGPLTAILLDDLDAAVAIAATSSELLRRHPATVLWLDEVDGPDVAGGLVVALNGKVQATHTWRSSGATDGPGDAAAVATALGVPDSTVALRALMRRSGHPRRLLAEAVSLLQLPAQSLEVLLEPPTTPASHVAHANGQKDYRRAYRAARLIPLPRSVALVDRYQWLFPGGVACLMFGRAGLAAAEAGAATDDVIGFSVLGTVSCLATGLAIRRSRRSVRHQATLRQGTTPTTSRSCRGSAAGPDDAACVGSRRGRPVNDRQRDACPGAGSSPR